MIGHRIMTGGNAEILLHHPERGVCMAIHGKDVLMEPLNFPADPQGILKVPGSQHGQKKAHKQEQA
jgi:hypothetical protein